METKEEVILEIAKQIDKLKKIEVLKTTQGSTRIIKDMYISFDDICKVLAHVVHMDFKDSKSKETVTKEDTKVKEVKKLLCEAFKDSELDYEAIKEVKSVIYNMKTVNDVVNNYRNYTHDEIYAELAELNKGIVDIAEIVFRENKNA